MWNEWTWPSRWPAQAPGTAAGVVRSCPCLLFLDELGAVWSWPCLQVGECAHCPRHSALEASQSPSVVWTVTFPLPLLLCGSFLSHISGPFPTGHCRSLLSVVPFAFPIQERGLLQEALHSCSCLVPLAYICCQVRVMVVTPEHSSVQSLSLQPVWASQVPRLPELAGYWTS